MKTFKDLSFRPMDLPDHYIAEMFFDNGYGIAVLLGKDFWSNGVDSFEVKVIYEERSNVKFLQEDIFSYANENEINKIMEKLQKL